MWPFKKKNKQERKKKIYKVEYRDEWRDYGCAIVKADDEADAWLVARAMYFGVLKPTTCIRIVELRTN